MKKIFLLFIITINLNGYSQITLENQINTTNTDTQFIKTDNLGVKYVNYNQNNRIVNIYNLDHTLYNSITINVNSLIDTNNYPNIENVYVTTMTQHLFDNDDGIEFFVTIFSFDTNYTVLITKSAIIDDNGSIMFTFDNLSPPVISNSYMPDPNWLINTSNGVKMILVSNDKINIYGLPGTVSSITSNNRNSNLINGFPNPTHNKINISYHLPQDCKTANLFIYNYTHQLIKKYIINNNTNRIEIKTDNFANGVYFYQIVGNNYKSKTKRFIRAN